VPELANNRERSARRHRADRRSADGVDHLITAEERLKIAMARQ
jgi:hypothetical protein